MVSLKHSKLVNKINSSGFVYKDFLHKKVLKKQLTRCKKEIYIPLRKRRTTDIIWWRQSSTVWYNIWFSPPFGTKEGHMMPPDWPGDCRKKIVRISFLYFLINKNNVWMSHHRSRRTSKLELEFHSTFHDLIQNRYIFIIFFKLLFSKLCASHLH